MRLEVRALDVSVNSRIGGGGEYKAVAEVRTGRNGATRANQINHSCCTRKRSNKTGRRPKARRAETWNRRSCEDGQPVFQALKEQIVTSENLGVAQCTYIVQICGTRTTSHDVGLRTVKTPEHLTRHALVPTALALRKTLCHLGRPCIILRTASP